MYMYLRMFVNETDAIGDAGQQDPDVAGLFLVCCLATA
jgi:hypothetical protein